MVMNGRALEACGRGLYQDVISAFSWRIWGRPWKPHSGEPI